MALTREAKVHWRDSLDAALAEAGQQDKSVLLDFYSDT
jgi:hypothetical protein